MRFDNPFQMIQALDGAAIKLLLVLGFADKTSMGMLGEKQLQTLSGLTQNTVRKGLNQLVIFHLAQQNKKQNGWCLASNLEQLPLVAGLFLNNDLLEVADGDFVAEKKSQFLTPGATTTSTKESLITPDKGKVVEEVSESKNDSFDLSGSLVWKVLRSAGIGEPMASRLATLDHMTVEYVRAHISMADVEQSGTRLLIHRLKNADPMPKINRHGHDIRCKCCECQEPVEEWSEGDDEVESPEIPLETQTIWEQAVRMLATKYPRVDFETWIQTLQLVNVEGDCFTAITGNRYNLKWLEEHDVCHSIETALSEISHLPAHVRIEV